MKVFGITGWSGAGKTTLIEKLTPMLIGFGLKVSTLKHAHHSFDLDTPGKDSYRHRKSGATEVMICSRERWVLMHENRGQPEASLDSLIARMTPVDLLIVEGFKAETHDKLEVYRRDHGKPPLSDDDSRFVAVASDTPLPERRIPVLDLNDIGAIADFIVRHCGLERRQGAVA